MFVREVPALLGRFLHLPSPWALIYAVSILSSKAVQAPLLSPSLEQHGLLPISLYNHHTRALPQQFGKRGSIPLL